MMAKLLLLISIIAFANAMVPLSRMQRAISDESQINQDSVDEKSSPMNASVPITSTTSTPPPQKVICERQTPCFWIMYNPDTRVHIQNMSNANFCICGPGLECLRTEDDDRNLYVFRCRTREEVAHLVWDTD